MATIEEIFTKHNLIQAAKKVGKKKSAGIDGISAKESIRIINDNYDDIYKCLIKGIYIPDKVILKEIPKSNNKTRPIAIATAVDRCIQGCLNNVIYSLYENEMSPYSYGFLKGRNCMMAVNKVEEYLDAGYQWFVKVDLSGCFNHINQDRILYKLRQKVTDPRVMKLINKYLKVTYITCAGEYKSFIGCPQGSALSPLFANIILTEVDNEFTRRRYAFVRYADDIVVLYKSERATREGIHKIISFIRKCGLEINPDKVEIGNIKNGVNFLGFHIYMNNMIHVVPATGRYQRIKEKIRNIINNDNLDNMIYSLNQELRGWIYYYKDAEIMRKCNELDLFVEKEIKRVERRISKKINKEKLVNCHELYKKISASKPE